MTPRQRRNVEQQLADSEALTSKPTGFPRQQTPRQIRDAANGPWEGEPGLSTPLTNAERFPALNVMVRRCDKCDRWRAPHNYCFDRDGPVFTCMVCGEQSK